MTERTNQARGIALALLVGLGVLVLAILFTLFRSAVPDDDDPTASPTVIAGAPSADLSPSPTSTATGDTSPSAVATATVVPASPPTSPTATATASPSSTAAPETGWVEITDFPTYRGSTSVESIAAGGPGFVAVGSGGRQLRGRVWTSADGRSWMAQPDDMFGGYNLSLVRRVGETLYAFGRGPDGLRVWRSGNGRTWTSLEQSPELVRAAVNDVAVVDGTMVGVGYVDDPEGEFGSAVWRSTDGVDWQRVASPEGLEELWDVAARDSMIVGSGRWPHLSGPLIAYSTDVGDSWSAAETDVTFGLEGPGGGLVTVAGNAQRFVAVGYRDDASDYAPIALSSADGLSWTSVVLQTGDGFGFLEQVVSLPGRRFVALGTEGPGRQTGTARVTRDGVSWTEIDPLYKGEAPPSPPEGGDEVVTPRVVAASRAGVVVVQEWGTGVRVWFGPPDLFE